MTSDEEDEFEFILNIGDCTFDAMNMGDCELMKIPEQLEMGSCSSKSKKVLCVEESKDDEKIPSPSDLSPFMPSYLVQNAEILSAPVIIPPSQLAQSFRSLSTSSTSPSSKPPPTFKLATLPELSLETPAAAFMKQLEYSDSETSSDDDDDVVILEETGVGENNNVIFSKAADTSPVKTLPSKSRPSIINADVDMWKDFKIPKGPSKFPVKDSHFKEMIKCGGKMTSIRRFLTEENIIPNLDSVDNWKKIEAMYDIVVNIKKSVTDVKKVHDIDDAAEAGDLESQNLAMKKRKTDQERKQFSRSQFRNTVSTDPAINLSVQGFRRITSGNKSKTLDTESFCISGGQLEPQSGYKKKVSGEVSEEKDALTIGKMFGFDDLGLVMKKLFVHKFNKKLGARKATADVLEEFQT